MLTKLELDNLISKIQITPELRATIEMVLRNFEDGDEVTWEKIEIVIRLIIKK